MEQLATVGRGPARRVRGPEFTERDAAALLWLGEQYGATLDVLDVLLGRFGGSARPLSRWGTRNQVTRWKQAGFVTAEKVLGDMWVTPTRRGLDRAGLSFPVWPIPATRVRHCHAVNIVRLHYELLPISARSPWIAERVSYRERGRGTWHVPDGIILDPHAGLSEDGPARYIGVEVELTHKGRRVYAEEVFGKLRAGTVALSFYVPDEQFAARLRADIRAVLDKLGASVRVSVQVLPTVAGATLRGR